MNTVQRSFKCRICPTNTQEVSLIRTMDSTRFVYNNTLEWRIEEFSRTGKTPSYGACSRRLTELKRLPDYEFLKKVSCVPLQQTLRDQEVAWGMFFKGSAGRPQFRKKRDTQSIHYTSSGFTIRDGRLCLAKMEGHIPLESLPVPADTVSSMRVIRSKTNKWYVVLNYSKNVPAPDTLPKGVVGIDLGIKSLVVMDDGTTIPNPGFGYSGRARETILHRRMSSKLIGSSNREKARVKLAKFHEKVHNRRLDYLHKVSKKIANDNQVICVETLRIEKMASAACSKGLSRRIYDAGWAELVRQLSYKAEDRGHVVVKVSSWLPSSKMCSCCGYVLPKLDLSVRAWECPDCHNHHDRDINAARNIKAAGLAVLAHGGVVHQDVLAELPHRSENSTGHGAAFSGSV